MTGKNVFCASMSALGVVALMVIAYQLGQGRNGDTSEAFRAVIGERLASLDGIAERLGRLEEDVASLHDAPSEDALDGAGETAPDADGRWAAVQSTLSTLQLRIKGLEEDPVRRGYSFIESEDAEMRREGVNILRRVARFDPEARAAIRALLSDPSSRVREQAAQKLRDLKDKASAPQMVALLADPYARARFRAIQALGAMEAHEAAPEIGRNLISDPDDQVRRAAADVLGRLKSPAATEFLTEALKDRNEAVRGQAIASLGETGATSAAPLLRAIYDEDPGSHRRRLVLALKSLGDEVPLQREVGRLADLVTSAADEGVRQRAIRELRILDRDSSQEIFSRALEDPSPRVRREAEKALR